MLRDHLVCSINHQGIQHKLLSEGDISCTDALALAQSIESAEDDAKKIRGGPAFSQSAHHMQKGARLGSPTPPTSYCCGGLHLAPVCPHKEKVCRHYKMKVHLDRVCCAKVRALAKSDPSATGPSDKKSSKRTHYRRLGNFRRYKFLPVAWAAKIKRAKIKYMLRALHCGTVRRQN